jgi:hypothetical protein
LRSTFGAADFPVLQLAFHIPFGTVYAMNDQFLGDTLPGNSGDVNYLPENAFASPNDADLPPLEFLPGVASSDRGVQIPQQLVPPTHSPPGVGILVPYSSSISPINGVSPSASRYSWADNRNYHVNPYVSVCCVYILALDAPILTAR